MTAPDLAKLAALVDACRAADEARHPYEWGTAVDPRGYGNALIAYDDALVALSLEWRDIAALVAAAQARDPAVTINGARPRMRTSAAGG